MKWETVVNVAETVVSVAFVGVAAILLGVLLYDLGYRQGEHDKKVQLQRMLEGLKMEPWDNLKPLPVPKVKAEPKDFVIPRD